MPRIFIDGEHGTVGLELGRRLEGKSDIELISLPSESRKDRSARAERYRRADIVVLCLPDAEVPEALALPIGRATRVIDCTSVHRIDPEWVYGFSEMDTLQHGKIRAAERVSNPGCYATGAIALIRPLVHAGILPPDYPLVITAVSGYSGGGRALIERMEKRDHPDHVQAPHFLYGTSLTHKHVPEMQKYGLLGRRPIFSPSVGRFARGMLVQIPLHTSMLDGMPSLDEIQAVYARQYESSPHIEVATRDESLRVERLDPTMLNGTDDLLIHVFGTESDGQANLVAVLDNLGKGAAGAAVQNIELMLGS